eukprot:TRINITY_DN4042_c0_g1_i10.p1 TRINITY_DN4042_c0_g1~~TRINITY_DN4042_c0_g1_i10.p1  ORF type:complete len:167 (+),score=18.30 TRINITY_DN4042_c0_g1_i10:26-502(+)
MIRRPPRSTHCISSAASDVYKRQIQEYGEYEADGIGEVVQVASCICNDTFIMPLCLYYHPMQIACGCIYFSTLHLKTPLPNFGGNPWYKFLHSEIEFAHVQEIANYLKHIYKKIGERRGKGSVKQCPYTQLKYEYGCYQGYGFSRILTFPFFTCLTLA